MSLFQEVSKLVNTRDIRESAVDALRGENIKYYKLEIGTMYLMRERGRQSNEYANPFTLVRFKGVGTSEEMAGNLVNVRLEELTAANANYYFEGVDSAGNVYMFGAYAYENQLAVGSGATGVSFYSIKQ